MPAMTYKQFLKMTNRPVAKKNDMPDPEEVYRKRREAAKNPDKKADPYERHGTVPDHGDGKF